MNFKYSLAVKDVNGSEFGPGQSIAQVRVQISQTWLDPDPVIIHAR